MARAGIRISRCAVALAFSFVPLVIAAAAAHAQTETVLYSFCAQPACADGYNPAGTLTRGKKGALYGTTFLGGDANSIGTVFQLSRKGAETVLHSFNFYTDGYNPEGGVISDKMGNLYGTTYQGGTSGSGTAFELRPDGTETILHSFGSTDGDGVYPNPTLIRDKKGNLYGTTLQGGANGYGTVFEISPNGTETVLYNFCSQPGCTDGGNPYAGLVLGNKGNLYGVTSFGGSGNNGGALFRVNPSGTETVLYSFCSQPSCIDGAVPFASLTLDKLGNFYGTTEFGGVNNEGAVFEVTSSGGETVLHSFANDGTDGVYPLVGLVRDNLGNLYSATATGGLNGKGMGYEVSPGGTETVLYEFCSVDGCADGAGPSGGLILDNKGDLYGTTFNGGASGYGTVFKVTP